MVMKSLLLVFILLFSLSFSGCENNLQNSATTSQSPASTDVVSEVEPDETAMGTTLAGSSENSHMEEDMKIKIIVGNQELSASLEDNATSRAFVEMLPLTLPMLDLYDREMCYRFADALPVDNVATTAYEVGEIIYWPPGHSFVIMYAQNGERFAMQKIGKIDSGVEVFSNLGDTEVTFELIEE